VNAPTSPQTAAQPRPARPSFWDITQDDLLLAAGFGRIRRLVGQLPYLTGYC